MVSRQRRMGVRGRGCAAPLPRQKGGVEKAARKFLAGVERKFDRIAAVLAFKNPDFESNVTGLSVQCGIHGSNNATTSDWGDPIVATWTISHNPFLHVDLTIVILPLQLRQAIFILIQDQNEQSGHRYRQQHDRL